MTYGPVGIRCPDHATHGRQGRGAAASRRREHDPDARMSGPIVTQTLIAVNVAVFLIQLFNGADLMRLDTGWIYENGVLVDQAVNSSGQLVGVAEGEWWRLITATFLHGSLIHLGMNMLVLWLIGPPVEEYFGHARYLLLYLVSGLAGSAGALILSGGQPDRRGVRSDLRAHGRRARPRVAPHLRVRRPGARARRGQPRPHVS